MFYVIVLNFIISFDRGRGRNAMLPPTETAATRTVIRRRQLVILPLPARQRDSDDDPAWAAKSLEIRRRDGSSRGRRLHPLPVYRRCRRRRRHRCRFRCRSRVSQCFEQYN